MKHQTMRRLLFIHLAIIALSSLSVGCMSVPEGSSAIKQQALSFIPPEGKSGVYAIRPYRYTGMAVLFSVSLDYQEFGSLETSSYLYGAVPPGAHVLRIPGGGGKGAPFTAEAGKNYFFTIKPGWIAPQIDQVSDAEGQAYVRKFKLSGDSRFEYQGKPAP